MLWEDPLMTVFPAISLFTFDAVSESSEHPVWHPVIYWGMNSLLLNLITSATDGNPFYGSLKVIIKDHLCICGSITNYFAILILSVEFINSILRLLDPPR